MTASFFLRTLRGPILLTLPALAILALVMAVPLGAITLKSVTDPALGVDNYVWFFQTTVNLIVLKRTLLIAFWVTIVCVLAAYPYAFAMTVAGPRLRIIMIMLVLIPFWVSGVVRTLAWVILLQDSGVINSLLKMGGFEKIRLIRTQFGVTVGMAQILLPFMVMPLYSNMRGIDLRLVQAAKSLGASPMKAFIQVYLPLSLPGVLSGATLVFILALGFYITPLLLGGTQSTMLSTLIQQQVLSLLNWGRGGAMGVILLVVTFAILAIASPFLRKQHGVIGASR